VAKQLVRAVDQMYVHDGSKRTRGVAHK
jgi:hypothetical protein